MNTLKIIETHKQDMESRIDEMLQAQESIELYKTRVVQPFEAKAKEIGGTIYAQNGIKVQVVESERQVKPNQKQTLERLAGHLEAAVTNQAAGKQMYGVRRFGAVVAIDAHYLAQELTDWQKPTGITTSISVTYKKGSEKEGIADLARTHCGRLTTIAHNQPHYAEKLTRDDVALYIAASEQITALGKHKIKPVADAIKKTAEPHDTETTFDRQDYGEFTTQVTTVPRYEPDYACVLGAVEQTLAQAQTASPDGKTLIYNTDLAEPRMYVAISALQQGIAEGLLVQHRKQKQEISVLHKPEKAMVLALD